VYDVRMVRFFPHYTLIIVFQTMTEAWLIGMTRKPEAIEVKDVNAITNLFSSE